MISHQFLLWFWPINYHFKGKNMYYKMVQNSTRSNGQIKNSTFYHTRLGFWSYICKMDFSNVVTFLFTVQAHCIYFYPFWLWNSWFCTISNFFCLCSDAWIEAGQNMISTVLKKEKKNNEDFATMQACPFFFFFLLNKKMESSIWAHQLYATWQ